MEKKRESERYSNLPQVSLGGTIMTYTGMNKQFKSSACGTVTKLEYLPNNHERKRD